MEVILVATYNLTKLAERGGIRSAEWAHQQKRGQLLRHTIATTVASSRVSRRDKSANTPASVSPQHSVVLRASQNGAEGHGCSGTEPAVHTDNGATSLARGASSLTSSSSSLLFDSVAPCDVRNEVVGGHPHAGLVARFLSPHPAANSSTMPTAHPQSNRQQKRAGSSHEREGHTDHDEIVVRPKELTLTIGRDPSLCDVVIPYTIGPGPLFSREHCRLSVRLSSPFDGGDEGDGACNSGDDYDNDEEVIRGPFDSMCELVVRDCDSVNGTFVNGARLSKGGCSSAYRFHPLHDHAVAAGLEPLCTLSFGAGGKRGVGEALSPAQLQLRFHVYVRILLPTTVQAPLAPVRTLSHLADEVVEGGEKKRDPASELCGVPWLVQQLRGRRRVRRRRTSGRRTGSSSVGSGCCLLPSGTASSSERPSDAVADEPYSSSARSSPCEKVKNKVASPSLRGVRSGEEATSSYGASSHAFASPLALNGGGSVTARRSSCDAVLMAALQHHKDVVRHGLRRGNTGSGPTAATSLTSRQENAANSNGTGRSIEPVAHAKLSSISEKQWDAVRSVPPACDAGDASVERGSEPHSDDSAIGVEGSHDVHERITHDHNEEGFGSPAHSPPLSSLEDEEEKGEEAKAEKEEAKETEALAQPLLYDEGSSGGDGGAVYVTPSARRRSTTMTARASGKRVTTVLVPRSSGTPRRTSGGSGQPPPPQPPPPADDQLITSQENGDDNTRRSPTTLSQLLASAVDDAAVGDAPVTLLRRRSSGAPQQRHSDQATTVLGCGAPAGQEAQYSTDSFIEVDCSPSSSEVLPMSPERLSKSRPHCGREGSTATSRARVKKEEEGGTKRREDATRLLSPCTRRATCEGTVKPSLPSERAVNDAKGGKRVGEAKSRALRSHRQRRPSLNVADTIARFVEELEVKRSTLPSLAPEASGAAPVKEERRVLTPVDVNSQGKEEAVSAVSSKRLSGTEAAVTTNHVLGDDTVARIALKEGEEEGVAGLQDGNDPSSDTDVALGELLSLSPPLPPLPTLSVPPENAAFTFPSQPSQTALPSQETTRTTTVLSARSTMGAFERVYRCGNKDHGDNGDEALKSTAVDRIASLTYTEKDEDVPQAMPTPPSLNTCAHAEPHAEKNLVQWFGEHSQLVFIPSQLTETDEVMVVRRAPGEHCAVAAVEGADNLSHLLREQNRLTTRCTDSNGRLGLADSIAAAGAGATVPTTKRSAARLSLATLIDDVLDEERGPCGAKPTDVNHDSRFEADVPPPHPAKTMSAHSISKAFTTASASATAKSRLIWSAELVTGENERMQAFVGGSPNAGRDFSLKASRLVNPYPFGQGSAVSSPPPEQQPHQLPRQPALYAPRALCECLYPHQWRAVRQLWSALLLLGEGPAATAEGVSSVVWCGTSSAREEEERLRGRKVTGPRGGLTTRAEAAWSAKRRREVGSVMDACTPSIGVETEWTTTTPSAKHAMATAKTKEATSVPSPLMGGSSSSSSLAQRDSPRWLQGALDDPPPVKERCAAAFATPHMKHTTAVANDQADCEIALPTREEDDDDVVRGAVLAHPMGMGKTVTALAFLSLLWQFLKEAETDAHDALRSLPRCLHTSHALRTVLCVPKEGVRSWTRELDRWPALFGDGSPVTVYVLTTDGGETSAIRAKERLLQQWATATEQRAVLLITHSMLLTILRHDRVRLRRGADARSVSTVSRHSTTPSPVPDLPRDAVKDKPQDDVAQPSSIQPVKVDCSHCVSPPPPLHPPSSSLHQAQQPFTESFWQDEMDSDANVSSSSSASSHGSAHSSSLSPTPSPNRERVRRRRHRGECGDGMDEHSHERFYRPRGKRAKRDVLIGDALDDDAGGALEGSPPATSRSRSPCPREGPRRACRGKREADERERTCCESEGGGCDERGSSYAACRNWLLQHATLLIVDDADRIGIRRARGNHQRHCLAEALDAFPPSTIRLAMTGWLPLLPSSPHEGMSARTLGVLFTLMSIVQPGRWQSRRTLRRALLPSALYRVPPPRPPRSPASALSPFVLCCSPADVCAALPPVIETTMVVDLSPLQYVLFRELVRGMSGDGATQVKTEAEDGSMRRGTSCAGVSDRGVHHLCEALDGETKEPEHGDVIPRNRRLAFFSRVLLLSNHVEQVREWCRQRGITSSSTAEDIQAYERSTRQGGTSNVDSVLWCLPSLLVPSVFSEAEETTGSEAENNERTANDSGHGTVHELLSWKPHHLADDVPGLQPSLPQSAQGAPPKEEPALAHSWKMAVLFALLRAARRSGERVVVFSHSVDSLVLIGLLAQQLDGLIDGEDFALISSTLSLPRRHAVCDGFNDRDSSLTLLLAPFALLTSATSTASSGLQLAGADRVVLFDMSTAVTSEAQAISRVCRMGRCDEANAIVSDDAFRSVVGRHSQPQQSRYRPVYVNRLLSNEPIELQSIPADSIKALNNALQSRSLTGGSVMDSETVGDGDEAVSFNALRGFLSALARWSDVSTARQHRASSPVPTASSRLSTARSTARPTLPRASFGGVAGSALKRARRSSSPVPAPVRTTASLVTPHSPLPVAVGKSVDGVSDNCPPASSLLPPPSRSAVTPPARDRTGEEKRLGELSASRLLSYVDNAALQRAQRQRSTTWKTEAERCGRASSSRCASRVAMSTVEQNEKPVAAAAASLDVCDPIVRAVRQRVADKLTVCFGENRMWHLLAE